MGWRAGGKFLSLLLLLGLAQAPRRPLVSSIVYNRTSATMPKKVSLREPAKGAGDPGYLSSDDEGNEYFDDFKRDSLRRESKAADQLSMRLLQVDDDDSDTEDLILRESLNISVRRREKPDVRSDMQEAASQAACERLCTMASLVFVAFALVAAALWIGVEFIGPPNQPVGPYELVERQVCCVIEKFPYYVSCACLSHHLVYLLSFLRLGPSHFLGGRQFL
jgi:hypothetical protein